MLEGVIKVKNVKIEKTYMAKPGEISHDWYIVDAAGKTLGRLATEVARILRGKHKPQYTPHIDSGDYVVVINAAKVEVTGRKLDQKNYYHFSGYPSGLKATPLRKMMEKSPDQVIIKAVRGMLPHNVLGRKVIKKLKVYAGSEHPHQAQQPQPLEL
ncbi:MAG: 50S ribosomal protein L13 [Chloroflexota bacterium]|nr:50S ribosomal protein L13 [Chloroflexota bacterium]